MKRVYSGALVISICLCLTLLADNNHRKLLCENLQKKSFGFSDKTYITRCTKNRFDHLDIFDGYKSPIINRRILHAIAGQNPKISQLHSLGTSHYGNKVWALLMTDGNSPSYKPSIFLNCAHHASEVSTPEFCYQIISDLLDISKRHYLKKYRFWIVPIVNPDGSENFWHRTRYSGRKNGRDTLPGEWNRMEGVDLNRNYPFMWNGTTDGSSGNKNNSKYRGPSAASEPEVQAIMNLANQEHFVLSLTFHTNATKILTPYTIKGTQNPTPEIAKGFAEILAEHSETGRKDRPKYKVVKNLYSVDGTDQDWHFFAHGTIALLVEGPFFQPTYDVARHVTTSFMPGFWKFLEKYNIQPKLRLKVINENNQGIIANVSIEEFNYAHGEQYFTLPTLGIREILFKEPGKYHLIVKTEAHSITEEIIINDGVNLKTIVVPSS